MYKPIHTYGIATLVPDLCDTMYIYSMERVYVHVHHKLLHLHIHTCTCTHEPICTHVWYIYKPTARIT